MSKSTSEPPPPYAKDPRPDPNISSRQPPPRAHGWESRQTTDYETGTTQTGPPLMPMFFPMNGNYAQFSRNCHHQWSTQFGLLGIFCAIIFFPLGLLCLLCDRQEVCIRCGARRFPGF